MAFPATSDALNINDQDSLNSAAGGNFLDKMPRECLKIIESKSKVRQTRAKAVVAKVSTNSSTQAVSPDVAELKDIVRALLLDKKNQASAPAPAPAPVKAVELSCVTCGGAHSHQNCPATHGDVYHISISEYVSQAAAANQVSSNFRPQMVTNHIRPPGFPPVQNPQANNANANNFNRGNNFNQNRESNFNQNRGGNFNQSNFSQNQLHRPQVNQSPAYQAPVPQTHSVTKNDFDNYVKANDAIMRNMQNNLQNQGSGTPVVKPIPEVTKDQVHPSCSQSTAPVQPPVGPEPITTPVFEPIVAPVVAPVPNTKPSVSLPYPSRRDNEKSRNQANEQIDKFYEIFKKMSFEISFTDALVLMPKFASTLRTLLGNKEKLTEVARTSNEPCLARTSMNEHLFGGHLDQVTQKTWKTRGQTSRYSANYTHMTANKIDVIDMACEEYSQEVLGFTDIIASGNSTPYYDPIVATSSPTLTPFGDSDFLLLEEADSFLGLADDPDSNSSVDEPTEVELKELPPHLEYAFLEGDNKLPVIIAKELDVEEKSALIKVLKSHKRALAWKLSDIQGINPEFCTHKILMEEDYAPAVQHQRRVNPKIHDVIKKEVEKLLEAGLIYLSDSSLVSRYIV
ncbi:hypothetical protein Tco_0011960 [Tanacetum coccineum]